MSDNAMYLILERINVIEERLNALVEQERFDREVIRGIEGEVITLKKIILGVGKYDVESAMVHNVKEVLEKTRSHSAELRGIKRRSEDHEDWLRHIILGGVLLIAATIVNGVTNLIWFLVRLGGLG